MMTDDANAPTIPDTHRPTPVPSSSPASAPDDRYVLQAMLGRGGMGEVWLANDKRVDREIAIKVMRGGTESPDAVARFLREARVQGRLEHPCVVPVHDLGSDGKAPYFAMKRLSGTTLADVLAAKDTAKWPRRTLLARFVDICLAIEFAHQRGVVHRDLKPANIMLGDFGEAYVLDWGVARLRDDVDTPVTRPSDSERDTGSTQTEAGAVLGTPGYMAPEQLRGERVDHRADVYALGCILFEILTGQPANARGAAIVDTLSSDRHRPSARKDEVPPELDAACSLATEATLEARLPSAQALADRVQKFLDGDRDVARRRELAAERVAQATASLEKGDAGRADAMRDAGSALALDQENREAQALLARLLLEPPATTPPEAQARIDTERTREAKEMLTWIVVNYVLFLVGITTLYVLDVGRSWPVLLILGELLGLTVMCLVGTRRPQWIGRTFAIVLTVSHCVLMASACVLLGPLLLGPSLIFGSSTVLLTGPILRVPKLTVVLHLLIIAVPFVLELVGVLPRTFTFDGAGGLQLRPWALQLSQVGLVATLLGTAGLQLIGNAFVLHKQRVLQDEQQRQLHVQAWQLKKLVPTEL